MRYTLSLIVSHGVHDRPAVIALLSRCYLQAWLERSHAAVASSSCIIVAVLSLHCIFLVKKVLGKLAGMCCVFVGVCLGHWELVSFAIRYDDDGPLHSCVDVALACTCACYLQVELHGVFCPSFDPSRIAALYGAAASPRSRVEEKVEVKRLKADRFSHPPPRSSWLQLQTSAFSPPPISVLQLLPPAFPPAPSS